MNARKKYLFPRRTFEADRWLEKGMGQMADSILFVANLTAVFAHRDAYKTWRRFLHAPLWATPRR